MTPAMNKRYFISFALTLLTGTLLAQTYTMPSGSNTTSTTTTCSGTFVDNGGGGGNYSNNQNTSYTFYPTSTAQYTRVTFTTFATENTFDYLYIYDGPSGPLIASYTGTPAVPFTITASASNATHGLTFRFYSDGSNRTTGWVATISCVGTAGSAPAFTPSAQDCEQGGGTTICANTTFSGNSSGAGSVTDLTSLWDGCLSGENQSSWYYFSPSASGTVGFSLTPANGTDDYDFAIWGPYTTVTCPSNVTQTPLRCSWAAGSGATGLGNGASDLTEGAGGNGWVQTINVTAGEIYVMVIDNYSASSSPFTLTWNLTGGASLNCTVLPVELIQFDGEQQGAVHHLRWATATEINNDYFTLERSTDGISFTPITQVDGAGNSSSTLHYSFDDTHPKVGMNYYRLIQTDYNGQSSRSNIVALNYKAVAFETGPPMPNPTSSDFSFELTAPSATTIEYKLYDVMGRQVRSGQQQVEAGVQRITIPLGEQPKGVYMFGISTPDGSYQSIKQVVRY